MPKARQKTSPTKKGVEVGLQTKCCKTFNDVKNVNLTELKKMCRDFGIDSSYGRHALVNLVCIQLGIPTHGKENAGSLQPRSQNHGMSSAQIREFQSLGPKELSVLKDWTKDLTSIPDVVDDSMVKRYLRDSEVISEAMGRTYKICRPYQLKAFIHSMKFHHLQDNPNFIAVQAQCNPSQSAQAQDVKVIFLLLDEITGQPYGGYCTCTVG